MPHGSPVPFAQQLRAGKAYAPFDPIDTTMSPLMDDAGTFPCSIAKHMYRGGAFSLSVLGSPAMYGVGAIAGNGGSLDGQANGLSGIRGVTLGGANEDFGWGIGAGNVSLYQNPRFRAIFTEDLFVNRRLFVGFNADGIHPVGSDAPIGKFCGLLFTSTDGLWKLGCGNGAAGTYEPTGLPAPVDGQLYIVDVLVGSNPAPFLKVRINGLAYQMLNLATLFGGAETMTPDGPSGKQIIIGAACGINVHSNWACCR